MENYIGPNQKGNAARDKSKVVRCGTHLYVLEQVFNSFGKLITSAIEHGCGHNSTNFFANRCQLTSIEDVDGWKINVGQKIIGFEQYLQNPTTCDCFLIDGRTETERLQLLDVVFKNKLAKFIVLHDAESYAMIKEITEKSRLSGFDYHQYVGLNPETLLFIDKTIDYSSFDFTDYVSMF